mmetsp:Transcript_44058/g.121957  ORF Transcript_44058/g.121957 Transcript_44058/m.121957 type:complete len:388 (+) Transcript_44058:96-1259(+)
MASQATDPRLRTALPNASGAGGYGSGAAAAVSDSGGAVADPRLAAKRPRVAEPSAASNASAPAAPVAASPPIREASGEELSARILQSLQRWRPAQGGNAAAPQDSALQQQRASEPPLELGAMLMNSLRTLMPTGDSAAALQTSQAGQELFRMVQGGVPAQGVTQANLVGPTLLTGVPGWEQTGSATPASGSAWPRAAAVQLRPRPRELEDDGSDDDEGVPHRLPPNFGAIPEDLLEERQRQREELRMRQIKATQPCRFGKACKRRDCPNMHQDGRDIDTVLNLCSFGKRCKRRDCFYDHPEGREIDFDPTKAMCRFGARCRRPDCLYDHPPGRDPVSGPDSRICYFCHDSGHIAQDCPRNPESFSYNRDQDVQKEPQKSIPAISATA